MNTDFQRALKEYKAGQLPKALKFAQSAVGKAGPHESGVQALIGSIQYKLGERLPAADAFARAGSYEDDKAAGFMKLAVTLFHDARRFDRVIADGPRAVALNPNDSDLAYLVGSVFFGNGLRGDMSPIIAKLERSNDRHMALIINYYRLSGRLEELYDELNSAIASEPHNAFLHMSRYVVAREICDFAALREHDRQLETPDAPVVMRQIAAESALGRLLWCGDEAINARPSQDTRTHSANLERLKRERRAISPAGSKLTIGYLSNDFFDHATMTLFMEAMAQHDLEKFDIVLLCYGEQSVAHHRDAWPQHLRQAVVTIDHLSDDAVADLIGERGIDILVDLKGHTLGARLGIVNRSDAPIKATYLGFPGSVAGIDLDYAITDPIVTPDSSKPHWAEKLCRLPESYQANNWETRPKPERMSRRQAGLPDDAFVFASFNATFKITPRTFDMWAEVLNAVPGSVFWVMCNNPLARRNLTAAFAEQGISRDRIIFAERAPYPDHINRLPLADLALDTIPCNGHTTTSDMLWAGLPVITVKGTAFAGRVSESLLTALGVPELVLDDEKALVAEAARLAADPQALAAIRARMEAARFTAPLFDNERFARHLETAYEMMAVRARAGLKPDHIDVPALPARTDSFV